MVAQRGRWLRTISVSVCGDGGGVRRGPRATTSFGSQHELYPARLALHRQTSAHERRKGTREGSIEVGHFSIFMHPASLAVDNAGRAPQIGARHEEADAQEGGRYTLVHRVSGSEPLSLRTHIHRGRSRPLRSAIVEYLAPSVAV